MAPVTIPPRTIPGPQSLFGWHATFLKLSRSPFVTLRHLHDTYGEVVAAAQGDPSRVFAFGPALNLQVLSHPTVFDASRPPMADLQEEVQETALGRVMSGLFAMNGEHHKRERHLMQPAFHKKQIGHYYQETVTAVQQTLDEWQGASEIDLFLHMRQLIHRIRMKVFFGSSNERDVERLSTLLDQILLLIPRKPIAPFNLPGTAWHRLQHLAAHIESLLHPLVAQQRTNPEPTTVLAALLALPAAKSETLSDEELMGLVFAAFNAGYTNTPIGLTWTIFLLSQHPRVCADLLDELDGTLHGSAPTFEQMTRLPLLEGVVKESLRLLPPFFMISRITTASCDLGGFTLPKGATVALSPSVTHRMPALYEQPDRFWPERWATLKPSPYEFIPFGVGHYGCLGADLAMQEMKVVVALVLQRYRLTAVPKSTITPNRLLQPTYGMPMHLVPQDRQFQHIPVRGTIHQLVDFGEASSSLKA